MSSIANASVAWTTSGTTYLERLGLASITRPRLPSALLVELVQAVSAGAVSARRTRCPCLMAKKGRNSGGGSGGSLQVLIACIEDYLSRLMPLRAFRIGVRVGNAWRLRSQDIRRPSKRSLTLTPSSCRSLRWSSGNPRMLKELVREFESRRGEILNLLAKKKGINC